MSRARSGTFPSDRVSDRPTNDKRMPREDGASHARLRHLTPEEQALKDRERADAYGNLAAMCFERVEIDLSYTGGGQRAGGATPLGATAHHVSAGGRRAGFPTPGRHTRVGWPAMSGLPSAGQWKPDPLPVGTEVVLNGEYRFRVTLHGPNVERECVGCGGVCYSIPGYREPRCGGCLQDHCGAMSGVGRMALAEHPPKRP